MIARISDGAKADKGQRRWAGYHFYLFQDLIVIVLTSRFDVEYHPEVPIISL
jgi:hypothetical protein